MEIVANGRINSDGRLVISPDERAEFLAEISRKRNKGCRVKVVVDGKKRSLEQNSYYYGVVVGILKNCIQDEWGERMTKEDVHEILKTQCNWQEHFSKQTGESIKVAQSTATLTTVEFEEYLERCRRFAQDFFGVTIPLPNEQIEIEL
jgi:hypothetical protein